MDIGWQRDYQKFREKNLIRIEDIACYVNDLGATEFVETCAGFDLEEGQGVAGKVLLSNIYIVPDVSELDLADYPFVYEAFSVWPSWCCCNQVILVHARSTMNGIKTKIVEFVSQLLLLITSHLPSRLMPAPSPRSADDLESGPSSQPQPSPSNTTSESQAPPSPQSPSGVRDPLPPTTSESQRNNILDAKPGLEKELKNTILGFCFGAAIQIATPSKQAAESEINNSNSLLSLGTAAIFGSLFTSHFIGEKKPTASRVLDKVAFFLAATTFFFAIATPCPLGIKIAIWALYIISLIASATCSFPLVFWRRVDTRATSPGG